MDGNLENWQVYKSTGDSEAREKLILAYTPLVKYVAGRLSVGMPPSVDHADLVSYGMFGLMDAIEKFDLDKGFKFETYAVSRIKGSIIDELRSADWVPRSVRSRAKKIEYATSRLEADLGRTPSSGEIAAELEWTMNEFADAQQRTSQALVIALDEPIDIGEGDQATLVDTVSDGGTPELELASHQARGLLQEALAQLGEREQAVLGLYYFHGMTLGEAGEILGVTESRVCQIHTKAVLGLRQGLFERVAA